MRIKEIAEELTNLNVYEVQSLAMLMNKNDGELPPIPAERPELKKYGVTSPKEYGMNINYKRRRK